MPTRVPSSPSSILSPPANPVPTTRSPTASSPPPPLPGATSIGSPGARSVRAIARIRRSISRVFRLTDRISAARTEKGTRKGDILLFLGQKRGHSTFLNQHLSLRFLRSVFGRMVRPTEAESLCGESSLLYPQWCPRLPTRRSRPQQAPVWLRPPAESSASICTAKSRMLCSSANILNPQEGNSLSVMRLGSRALSRCALH